MKGTTKTSTCLRFSALLARMLGSCMFFAALFIACHTTATHSNAENTTANEPNCHEPNCSGTAPDYENAPLRIVTVEDVCLIFDAIAPFRATDDGWSTGLAHDGFDVDRLNDLRRFDKLPQTYELLVGKLSGGYPTDLGGRRYIASASAIMADNFGAALDILGGLPDWARPEYVLEIDDCRESPEGFFVRLSAVHVQYVSSLERVRPRGMSGGITNLWLEIVRTKDGPQAKYVAFQDN